MLAKLPIRGQDVHGSGAFGAPRGSRTHKGVDLACYVDTQIYTRCAGVVIKLGYPYDFDKHPGKTHLRYVKIKDDIGQEHRYMYISPLVQVGDHVAYGDLIGMAQDLTPIYPGITNHIHYDIKRNGVYINPTEFV